MSIDSSSEKELEDSRISYSHIENFINKTHRSQRHLLLPFTNMELKNKSSVFICWDSCFYIVLNRGNIMRVWESVYKWVIFVLQFNKYLVSRENVRYFELSDTIKPNLLDSSKFKHFLIKKTKFPMAFFSVLGGL
jgi:hypothetical protein